MAGASLAENEMAKGRLGRRSRMVRHSKASKTSTYGSHKSASWCDDLCVARGDVPSQQPMTLRPYLISDGCNWIAIEDGGAPIGAQKLRALHAAAGRLIHQSPPKAAPAQPSG